MTLTVDFIEDIVTSMTPTIDIDGVVDNGDNTQTISVCNTYWIRTGLTVTIGGVDYVISSFVKNVSFTIPTPVLVTAIDFVLQAPYYFHGSPMQVNDEHLIIKISANKYPLIYLVEVLTDSVYDELDSREKDMPLRIFFLDALNSKSDVVNQHFTNVVKPLNASLNFFVEKLQDSSRALPFSYDVTNRIKVGVYTTNQGNTEEIFSDPLDGVEFVSTVTIFKDVACDC